VVSARLLFLAGAWPVVPTLLRGESFRGVAGLGLVICLFAGAELLSPRIRGR
jgi:hypothetical protein